MGAALLVVWAIGTLISLLGAALAFYKFELKERPLYTYRKKQITILKPIKGMSAEIEAAIKSFFLLSYMAGDELIFCVEDLNDPAVSVTQKLIQKYPKVPARLTCTPTSIGVNQKVNNIYTSYLGSVNDLILISDDNAIASSNYLLAFDNEFKEGVLSSIILAKDAKGFGGLLEQMIMSTFYTKGLLLAHAIGHPCVMGKSMMLDHKDIPAWRWKDVAGYLAEDYETGKMAKAMGLPVKLLSCPVEQSVSNYSFQLFWNRHMRWGLLRKFQAMPVFFLEPFFYSSIGSWAVGSLGVYLLTPENFGRFTLVHWGLWALSDFSMQISLEQPKTWKMPFAWAALQLLHPVMWVRMALGDSIEWRGVRYRLHLGGIVSRDR